MKRIIDLYDLYSSDPTETLFYYLTGDEISFWDETLYTVERLNILYASHSAEKIANGFLTHFIDEDTDSISVENKQLIGNALKSLFASKWNRIYTALIADYDPLENYDLTETENTETENLDVLSGSKTGQSNRSNTGTVRTVSSVDSTASDTEQKNYHGVNSLSADGVPKENISTSSTGSTDTDGTETRNLTDAQTDTETSTGRNERTESVGRTLTRHGNIGVTTSQQMLESELQIRKNLFLETVFEDIDSILTIPIY